MTREQKLQQFVEWAKVHISGRENQEAKIFLERLFKAFGHEGALEAGATFELPIKRSPRQSTAFADLLYPEIALIEMKKRGEDLTKHYAQVFDYWLHLTPYRPKYAILCNFDEFWVYDLDRQLYEPMDKVKLEELPTRWGGLAFLFPQDDRASKHVVFENDRVGVTEEAAASLSELFHSIIRVYADREIPREKAQRFVLQCMLAMFAEDIGLLPRYTFTNVVKKCVDGESTYDLITQLFFVMNYDGHRGGRFRDVAYFDGGIFAEIHPIELKPQELTKLYDTARHHDWSRVNPAIFGTIFENSLDENQRHQLGADFTSEKDIMRIVLPVIVRPWQQRIDAASTSSELAQVHHDLTAYRVLDPACGSGNFLYVAYREMKRLERVILDKFESDFGHKPTFPKLVSTHQFFGLDIQPFAVELAKVTLMIGKILAKQTFDLPENVLPLDNMDANILCRDALIDDKGQPAAWPAADVIIGNPPYQGVKGPKSNLPAAYLNQVRTAYPEVPGNADFCVYWFRKSHYLMTTGNRAGLVGTNTIRQNYSRIGGLDYIVANDGYIFEAYDSLPWSGDAAVHVSIACWTKGEKLNRATLWTNDGTQSVQREAINSSLSPETDVTGARTLSVNVEPKRVFQGQTPGHSGFVLSKEEALTILQKDSHSAGVIFPYLTGRDMLSNLKGQPDRWIIDFSDMDVMQAQQYKFAFKHIEAVVLPDKVAKADNEQLDNEAALAKNKNASQKNDHQNALDIWWQHFRNRPERKEGMANISRFIACSRVTKRSIFAFVSAAFCPSDALQTFGFDDDYSFGILQSNFHWDWFRAKSSTLKSDFRYTPSSIFDTFPWPQHPSDKQVRRVAEAAKALHDYRLREMERLSLRDMYATLEQPGKNPLRDLHTKLDVAVVDAYGFDPNKDMLEQLLNLNFEVVARVEAGESVTAPGIPNDFPEPESLVSEGCIQPPELFSEE
jgi:SAM-dependent methyltransferase